MKLHVGSFEMHLSLLKALKAHINHEKKPQKTMKVTAQTRGRSDDQLHLMAVIIKIKIYIYTL